MFIECKNITETDVIRFRLVFVIFYLILVWLPEIWIKVKVQITMI